MASELIRGFHVPIRSLLLCSQGIDFLSGSEQTAIVLLFNFGPNVIQGHER